MKRLSCVGLCALVVLSACGDPPPPDKVPALSSRVELAAGEVWLSSDGEQTRLITGAMLPQRAEVVVGTGGRALLRLGNGTGVFLRGGAKALVDGGSVGLEKGEIWADVPKDDREMGHFTAGDVTVTASDSGMDIARAADGAVTVYVARGLAVVAGPGGRTEVQSGEQAVIRGKAEPEVAPVSFWEDWTGGMADREILAGLGGKAAGRIYGIDRDRPGSPPQELQINYQSVRIYIRDGVAHTTVDQRFFNPTSAEVEGWYWFTVPEGASVERFAWEVNGALVDGEMIERKQAAASYEAAVNARIFEPALLEWVDGRTFRARIYPVPATGEKRVVLSYTQMLPLADGVYRYVYPMGGGDEVRIQEFSLQADLGDDGKEMNLATLQDATVEADGTKVTMRRSGFVPRSDFLLEMEPKEEAEPMRAMRFSSGRDEADYVMLRYSPEVDWSKQKEVPGDVVVVLDTSAGGDDAERQVRSDAVEAILRALSEGDRFAVVATDLKPRVLYPAKGLAKASEAEVSSAVESLAEVSSSGATDLGEMFGAALELVHEAPQPAVVYVGDGNATVGEITPDELADRLRRSMGDSRARLFTIAGGADANHGLLERLARVGGGRMFRIDTAEQTVQEALRFAGMLKTPTVTDLKIDAGSGLDQVFSTAAGKVSEGEEVIVLARTHHALPDEIVVTGRLAGEDFEKRYKPTVETGAELGYIPSIWARLYLERLMGEGLEDRRGSIISLGLAYGLMTPFTSFLVLDSDRAYELQGIKRRTRSHEWSLLDAEGSRLEALTAGEAAATPLLAFGCSSRDSDDRESSSKMEELVRAIETISQTAGDESVPSGGAPPSPPMASPATEEQTAAEPEMAEHAPAKSSARAKGGPSEMDDLLGGLDKAKDTGGLDGLGAGGGGYGLRGGAAKEDRKVQKGLGTGADGWSGRDVSQVVNPYDTTVASQEGPMFQTAVCSDASRQPLAHRRILWLGRLRSASAAGDYLRIFREAGQRCELPQWRERKVLLDLIEERARTAQDVRDLLVAFREYPKVASYLRQRIMRRSLDPDVTMGTYFDSGINWPAVRRGLPTLKTAQARVDEVKKILAGRPDDPEGRSLLVDVLIEAEQLDEARSVAARLRRDGLATPPVTAALCDLQAEAGQVEEARRTCSELVEFNPGDPMARQRLGDLFLRHGWYGAAYRQYRTLVDSIGEHPVALLRLAAAAAGMGKIDEALRIERKVSSGDGEPGADDPRRWARLHSAVRLGRLILAAKGAGDAETAGAMERSLKRTQVFGGSSSVVILVWEDLEAALELSATDGADPLPVSEKVSAAMVGLDMIDVGSGLPPGARLGVRITGATVRREIPFSMYIIGWDGKKFSIEERKGEIPARESELVM